MQKKFFPLDNILKIKGYTNDTQLADEYGWPRSTVASWRSGQSISLKYIIAFCDKEDKSSDQILAGEDFDAQKAQKARYLNEKEISPFLGEDQVDFRPLQADLRQVVDKLLKSLGELLEGIISRLNKIDGDHEKCRKELACMESEEEPPGPSQPAAVGSERKAT